MTKKIFKIAVSFIFICSGIIESVHAQSVPMSHDLKTGISYEYNRTLPDKVLFIADYTFNVSYFSIGAAMAFDFISLNVRGYEINLGWNYLFLDGLSIDITFANQFYPYSKSGENLIIPRLVYDGYFILKFGYAARFMAFDQSQAQNIFSYNTFFYEGNFLYELGYRFMIIPGVFHVKLAVNNFEPFYTGLSSYIGAVLSHELYFTKDFKLIVDLYYRSAGWTLFSSTSHKFSIWMFVEYKIK